MAETLQFELVSPERLLVSEPVEMVVVPGSEGDFGALPRHAPLITAVRPGIIDIYKNGQVSSRIFVAGGFAEVTGERCTVLAEEAVPVGELNQATIDARVTAAESAIEEASGDHERDQARQALEVAQAMRAALQQRTEH